MKIEYSTLIELARAIEGREIHTLVRGKPFRVAIMKDVGLQFSIGSKKRRPEYRQTIEAVLARFEATGSWRKSDYNDDSHNASYLLALISHFQDASIGVHSLAEAKLASELSRSVESTATLSVDELKALATLHPAIPAKVLVASRAFLRNPYVIRLALLRANGVCEACKCAAPFIKKSNGEPYLEVHHERRLADGGEDTFENAIALCPNCHRQKHYGMPC